jgi:hypothetical protein
MAIPTRQPPVSSPDPLPIRWALILLAALDIGVIFGGLTFTMSGIAPALLAALSASGVTVVGLHKLLP